MKKVSILLLSLLLALSVMTACGRNRNDKEQSNGTTNNTTQNDMNDQNGMGNGSANNNVQTPADDLADGVGDVADGVADGVNAVWTGILDFFDMDDRPRTIEGDEAAFEEYGLDESLIEEYVLQSPETSDTAHEFFIAKVRDGKMAEVEEILEQRKEIIAANWAETTDSSYDYAREPVILKSGNYIMLAVHEDVENIRTEFERLIGEMEEKE